MKKKQELDKKSLEMNINYLFLQSVLEEAELVDRKRGKFFLYVEKRNWQIDTRRGG